MYSFTFLSISQEPILYMDMAKHPREISLFLKVMNGDTNDKTVKHIQEMTSELRERLPLLDVIGEKAYRMKKYFEGIPDGQKFLLLPGHIEDRITLHDYQKSLYELNGITNNAPELDHICNCLRDYYEVTIYNGNERLKIGVEDKKSRVCRFCGKSFPDVHFKNKSHAISESLGNKGLICLEECDECNKRFNETIEQDIAHMFAHRLLLYGVAGKNGTPTIKGEGFSMKIDTSSRAALGRDTIVLTLRDMPNTTNIKEMMDGIDKIHNLYLNYIPQNVYKCFCKYALSLVNSAELPYFKNTIDWINEKPTKKRRLPPVWQYPGHASGAMTNLAPSIIIFRRKQNTKELPYSWAIINFAGISNLFIIPFCKKDRYRFVGKKNQAFFLNGLKEVTAGKSDFQPTDLCSDKTIKLKLRTTFQIPDDCVEGRDYYFIDPADNEQRYSEESHSTEPNAGVP